VFLILLAVLLLAVLLWKFLLPEIWYDTRAYTGDGQITDTGFWSYPRYHVEFANVAINERSRATFSFRGVPAEAFTFVLRTGSAADTCLLKDNLDKITVQVSLKDDHGNLICEASGTLRTWNLASSLDKAELWHDRCRDVRLSPRVAYTLALSVDPRANDLPSIRLKPVLEGGGNELP
jgi:hypothetical protein